MNRQVIRFFPNESLRIDSIGGSFSAYFWKGGDFSPVVTGNVLRSVIASALEKRGIVPNSPECERYIKAAEERLLTNSSC